MAKEVETTNEPSQSSSSIPPLGENEVELVIDRFWRDTRPRACVRSETKMVNGFNFRLLVWPQGSKQSQSHLSAFVEVVPVTASDLKADCEDGVSSSKSRPYPPDWACPCVFYRISVMNFKQKYPYSKADTWTFSYVCPDRGWHTLLDTRYINRRDGYLNGDGSLVIRAVAYPRFAHPIPVLPLLANVNHIHPLVPAPDASGSSQSSQPVRRAGLSNFLATDNVNALIQSLFHLPGFRRFIYSQVKQHGPRAAPCLEPSLTSVELETIEQGLESCAETIKEIMSRLSAAAPEMFAMIESAFIKDCQSGGFCRCNVTHSKNALSTLERLRDIYGRCQVLISCLEESLFSVSQSLFGRKATMKRTQFDAYRQIVKDCKRILSTVANPLFTVPVTKSNSGSRNLVEELQQLFARMEISTNGQLLDTRGILRELGFSTGGLLSAATPDGLFVVFYEALLKCVGHMSFIDEQRYGSSPTQVLKKMFYGKVKREESSGEEEFSHMRLADSKITSLDRHVTSWLGSEEGLTQAPAILTVQLLSKIKDRLDVSERLKFKMPAVEKKDADGKQAQWVPQMSWEKFLDHHCGKGQLVEVSGAKPASKTDECGYRLHAMVMSWGSDLATSHYSAVVRNHRLGGWTRFDDSFSEELVDICSTGGSSDWVFSPEWSCSSLIFVREDAIGTLYGRFVDVRTMRPDLFSTALSTLEGCVEPGSPSYTVLCNRSTTLASNCSSSSSLDPTCQVEVCLVTEKDVVHAAPGGFSVPFSFAASARKLIVRKDIAVERLMQAVQEHFKIPVSMQKLFALRYYSETGQERFEPMHATRSVMAYMDGTPSKSKGTAPSLHHQLYVYVGAARKPSSSEISVWIKLLDEKSLGMVSIGCLTVDPGKPLRDYFESVCGKAGSSLVTSGTQFVVFEEVGCRLVELRKTSVPIKAEKIMDGDILVFVPLTDAAKRALIGTSALVNTGLAKRRVLASSAENDSKEVVDCCSSSSCSSDESELLDEDEEDLNERCRKFLSQVSDEEDVDVLISEMAACAHELEDDEDCCGCREASRLNARIEVVRQYLRHRPELISREELRRLDIPATLREEFAGTDRCFYCQLPLGSKNTTKSVACTVKCLKTPQSYHERCVRELVAENGGSNACIITEGCRGRIIGTSVVGTGTKMSQAALRSKLTSVLATPSAPVLEKGFVVLNGKQKLVNDKDCGVKGTTVPPIPSALRGGGKKAGPKLPVEALWWNACLWAFGGFENLHAAVVEKHWDAADLAQAKAVFTLWCKQLLEKRVKRPATVPKTPAPLTNTKSSVQIEAPSSESSSGSESSESEEAESNDSESEVEVVPSSPESESDSSASPAEEESSSESVKLARMLDQIETESDASEDGFIVARSGRRKMAPVSRPPSETPSTRVPTAVVNTPTTPTPPSVVIPQGFFGAPKEVPVPIIKDEHEAEEAAACIAHQAIDSLLDEDTVTASISLVDSLVIEDIPSPAPTLLESRMALLPVSVRHYCLPVDLVFVYYSAQFFAGRETTANTVSLTPPSDADILDDIMRTGCAVSRLYTSPHQTFPDSPITVQWFVEFNTAQDCKQFAELIASTCPEWGPETGALLPASMLGFAV